MKNEFKSYCHEGAHPSIVINNNNELTDEQMLNVLANIREYIVNGGYANPDDSNEIGNKYTHCDWGLCSDSAKFYPEPEMHTFPQDFVEHGRISSLGHEGVHCPMRNKAVKDVLRGCFYDCRIFQKHLSAPSRDEAISLYDEAILKLKNKSEN